MHDCVLVDRRQLRLELQARLQVRRLGIRSSFTRVSLESRIKSGASSPFINIHETMGIKYFKGGPNISKNFGSGVQISRGPNIPLQCS